MPYNTKNIVRDQGTIPAPQHFNPITDSYEATQGTNGATHIKVIGNDVQASGKATATTSDQVITVNFNQIDINNDGSNELRISIDGDSTSSPKIIYIGAGESYEKALRGSSLHYSVALGTTAFRYVLS